MRYCDYYEQNVSEADFDEALEAYHRLCSDSNQDPEVANNVDLDDVSDSELSHVLYHAEMAGFELNPS